MTSIKKLYVGLMRRGRALSSATGLLDKLERNRESDLAIWARSLFAIYDIDDMVALDLPWWTFAAIRKVDGFLAGKPEARVFEYGSGASTVWLARRAAEVRSVEHDEGWAAVVRRHLRDFRNVSLEVVRGVPSDGRPAAASQKPGHAGLDFSDYVARISEVGGRFDLIVIDGRSRAHCLEAAISHLAADGLIVFDNSGRRRYRAAIEGSGLAHLETRGLTACLPYPDCTTLLSPSEATLAALEVEVS